MISAPVVSNDTGDSKIYTDINNASFNITAEPIRTANNSGHVSVKIETNKSVNKTFKLNFGNKSHIVKLDDNKSNELFTDDFSIESKTNKVLKLTDNTLTNQIDDTNDSNLTLNVKFENNEIINYNNLIRNELPTITINPTQSIQEAIDDAPVGSTILLEGGIYNEWNITVNKSNLTIKSVDGANVIVNATRKDRVFNVYTNTANKFSLNDSCNISGLTITGGNATNGSSAGGGICMYGSYEDGCFLSITNCTITNNIANLSDNGGAGIHAKRRTTIKDCIITDNSNLGSGASGNGGGICGGNDHGTVINCTITGNNATGVGGGVSSVDNVTNCTITGNNATNNGGGTYGANVINCTITNNTATSKGSTANAYGGGVAANRGSVDVSNCTITDNTVTYTSNNRYACGGGVSSYNTATVTSLIAVTNCTITGNNVTGTGYISTNSVYGGGVASRNKGDNVTNCTITDNTVNATSTYGNAYGGGGAYAGNVTNCTITGNNATGTNSKGGGVVSNNTGAVNYCRIYNNTAVNGSNANNNNNNNNNNGNVDFNWWGTNNITTTTNMIKWFVT